MKLEYLFLPGMDILEFMLDTPFLGTYPPWIFEKEAVKENQTGRIIDTGYHVHIYELGYN
ncbi:MAG: hypothetical protein ISN29_05380 [Gammaproteobacteria bacterium AqS3]|nr:hypothetical protein [Gammaproteobacteria bacterium AqS3]